VTSAFTFIYLINVIYTDLTCGNISLGNNLHAKLLNFSGSLLDSSKLSIIVTISYKYPRANLKLT
ncbi:uncharacterized protein K441DRAFT_559592, partial [Cenococcum geophilum 1.58]|uniref:uncharacterized protein n=1 Tax=Cenococcum geophilum 1.58 TaxID=794803 RepID=UPI00358E2073